MNKEEKEAVKILHKIIQYIPASSYSKKIGSLIKKIPICEREKLKNLKSNNIQDRILNTIT